MPEPEEAVLKQTPGVFEAWKGLAALPVKVCLVRGPKIVLKPDALAAFQHAPLIITQELNGLEEEHKQYEDLL